MFHKQLLWCLLLTVTQLAINTISEKITMIVFIKHYASFVSSACAKPKGQQRRGKGEVVLLYGILLKWVSLLDGAAWHENLEFSGL